MPSFHHPRHARHHTALTPGSLTQAGCTCILLTCQHSRCSCVLMCTVCTVHCYLRDIMVNVAAGGECCPHSATLVPALATARSHTRLAKPSDQACISLIALAYSRPCACSRACVLSCAHATDCPLAWLPTGVMVDSAAASECRSHAITLLPTLAAIRMCA